MKDLSGRCTCVVDKMIEVWYQAESRCRVIEVDPIERCINASEPRFHSAVMGFHVGDLEHSFFATIRPTFIGSL